MACRGVKPVLWLLVLLTVVYGARAASGVGGRGADSLFTGWVGFLLWGVRFKGVARPPFPNVADAFYYGSYVAQYGAIILLLRARLHPRRASLWLDGGVVGLAIAAFG